MIQSSLSCHLGNSDDIVSLVSIASVSKKDPAFKNPSKPIGPVYEENQLKEAKKLNPKSIFKEIGSKRYRRVVASPAPLSISSSRAVKHLLERNYVVITAGAGGIPVVKNSGKRTIFIDAVVDKDLASEKIATSIKASKFLSLTDVEGAYLDYRGSKKLLRNVTTKEMTKEMKAYLKNGEFGEGSMAPKVRAAVRFAESTGNSAIICSLTKVREALAGRTGTVIHK